MEEIIRILVVDDLKDMCMIIRDSLEETNQGYIVDMAYDGEQALANIRKKQYDVVILDYKLSNEMDGLTVLQKARSINPSTQIIMISAYGKESIKEKARELGAYAFIDKPFDLDQFLEIIKKSLAERKKPEGHRAL